MPSTPELPHWNLETIYPGLESPGFTQAVQSLKDQVAELQGLMDRETIRRGGRMPHTPEAAAEVLESYLARRNALLMQYVTLQAFVYGFVSTDSFNALAKRRQSELDLIGVEIETQGMRFKGWLGQVAGERYSLQELTQRSSGCRRSRLQPGRNRGPQPLPDVGR